MDASTVPGGDRWLDYGVLGLITLTCLMATFYIFRTLTQERKRQAEELKLVNDAHRAEMNSLLNRYIESSASQIREYHGLADKITGVLESLTRRFESRNGSRER